MPFDGAGNFTLVAGNPVVTGATISSTTHNNTNNDFASAFANCITRDGQSPATANIPMGSNKLTGLAAGTGPGESVRYEQFASPPAIGGTTPAAGAFTTLSATGLLTTNGQVSFPVTQNPSADANTLDDYEEGTYTPISLGFTSVGAGTYSSQIGRYTKVGNLCHVQSTCVWSAHTGTGSGGLGGLPFTASGSSFLAVFASNYALAANNYMTLQVVDGTTLIRIYGNVVGGGAFTTPALDTAAEVDYGGTYITA